MSLDHMWRCMLPYDLSNVVPLRPENEKVQATPEDAFLAWTLDLPQETDIAQAARVALSEMRDKGYEGEGVEVFESYLRDAAKFNPPRRLHRGKAR